ncbi:MAG: PEP/pyruvate-binding domain-containing protein [Anaerolineales bacterium]|nr:PEP/pyruvate-binding domain-containing protein [Anaerolineales bacterium]MDW8445699.1 PEP/pyruvate-binding domain-containing protein [Anaerolineales bacterium]
MTFPSAHSDLTLRIYLTLAQYPILSALIRERMRAELFQRGVISAQAFENEVRYKAIKSQQLEGLHDPLVEEPYETWEQRLSHVRDHLTDFYFAYNLPYELFEQIVRQTLAERGRMEGVSLLTYNPELTPQPLLFEQGYAIERLPPEEQEPYRARLSEIKAVLVRTLISDQLGYVKIARKWFTIGDLDEIRKHKIGGGKIGGKAAGMLLAARILRELASEEVRQSIRMPTSYYIGANVMYDFFSLNHLTRWMDQKYKTDEEIYAEFPQLQAEFLKGQLPPDIVERLAALLRKLGKRPLIVRSSSLLEDNFGTSFAGKYESHFCPNQGSLDENLEALCKAILRVYASIFNPDALLYRRTKGLQDYDERMAILLQVVEGERFGDYYLPHGAGVAYSQNIYRWSPQIRREEGFMRLVWGLGTRAVERTGNDYPRLVALSHPTLHPESNLRDTVTYSQKYVDVIDLAQNRFRTLPITEVLRYDYPPLRYIAQLDEGGYLASLRSILRDLPIHNLVITFDELFRRSRLAQRMREVLRVLEEQYQTSVDLEFALQICRQESGQAEVEIVILQCRPHCAVREEIPRLPENLPESEIIFLTPRMAPRGYVANIRYVLFVSPREYFALPSSSDHAKLRWAISRLNQALAGENFICVGPGRWGTSTPDLGVTVGYGDIYHTRALVELTGEGLGAEPEPSYGTHFFQDLLESNIYPLAIHLKDRGAIFNKAFFYHTPSCIHRFLNSQVEIPSCLRLLAVEDFRPNHHIDLVMDTPEGHSIAFLVKDS